MKLKTGRLNQVFYKSSPDITSLLVGEDLSKSKCKKQTPQSGTTGCVAHKVLSVGNGYTKCNRGKRSMYKLVN